MPKNIFHRSRRVLDDCKIALDKFNEEPSDIEFRLTLVTCISLLRLVGHVIKSEAAELGLSDQNHQLWEQEKSSDIFSQFISESTHSACFLAIEQR